MLKAIIEDNENDKFAFIYQTEAFLQIVNQQLNFENYDEEEVKSRGISKDFILRLKGEGCQILIMLVLIMADRNQNI